MADVFSGVQRWVFFSFIAIVTTSKIKHFCKSFILVLLQFAIVTMALVGLRHVQTTHHWLTRLFAHVFVALLYPQPHCVLLVNFLSTFRDYPPNLVSDYLGTWILQSGMDCLLISDFPNLL